MTELKYIYIYIKYPKFLSPHSSLPSSLLFDLLFFLSLFFSIIFFSISSFITPRLSFFTFSYSLLSSPFSILPLLFHPTMAQALTTQKDEMSKKTLCNPNWGSKRKFLGERVEQTTFQHIGFEKLHEIKNIHISSNLVKWTQNYGLSQSSELESRIL